jgi:ABC-type polysaccharide/polyol phosphate export permease
MSALTTLLSQREARAGIAVLALIPTLFLFFALTLAVDPSQHLDKVRLGVAVLDAGVQTPQGQVSAANRLVEGWRQQLPVELVQFSDEGAVRDAVFAHDLAAGVVLPAGMTENLQAGRPVTVQLVKSDANDVFTNAFVTNLQTQLATNLNAAVQQLLAGQQGATPAQPAAPLVSVTPQVVAASKDFRFPAIPSMLVLPMWVAVLAFAALVSRAGIHLRETLGMSRVDTGIAELVVGIIASGLAAAVITLDLGLFMWRWDLDFLGLFAFLWLGLLAMAWLLQGTIRLLGFALGVATGVVALFVQQPVSGAAYPPSFAPDVVRWAADVAPLRYMLEGIRNLLIGGSTTWDMAAALAIMAAVGLALYAAGIGVRALLPNRRRPQPAPVA